MRAFVCVISMACGLFACGGQKIGGGKEGAAAALFSALGPAQYNGSSAGVLGQGLSVFPEVKINCPGGGTASLKNLSINPLSNSFSQNFTMSYNNCSTVTWDNPNTTAVETDKVTLGGDMNFAQSLNFDLSQAENGSVEQTVKGRLNFGGVFSDFLESDVTQKMEWSLMDAIGGSITFTLNGSIKTSTETYTYNNETVSIQAGTIPALPENP